MMVPASYLYSLIFCESGFHHTHYTACLHESLVAITQVSFWTAYGGIMYVARLYPSMYYWVFGCLIGKLPHCELLSDV